MEDSWENLLTSMTNWHRSRHAAKLVHQLPYEFVGETSLWLIVCSCEKTLAVGRGGRSRHRKTPVSQAIDLNQNSITKNSSLNISNKCTESIRKDLRELFRSALKLGYVVGILLQSGRLWYVPQIQILPVRDHASVSPHNPDLTNHCPKQRLWIAIIIIE